jgi:hypothetical protein
MAESGPERGTGLSRIGASGLEVGEPCWSLVQADAELEDDLAKAVEINTLVFLPFRITMPTGGCVRRYTVDAENLQLLLRGKMVASLLLRIDAPRWGEGPSVVRLPPVVVGGRHICADANFTLKFLSVFADYVRDPADGHARFVAERTLNVTVVGTGRRGANVTYQGPESGIPCVAALMASAAGRYL